MPAVSHSPFDSVISRDGKLDELLSVFTCLECALGASQSAAAVRSCTPHQVGRLDLFVFIFKISIISTFIGLTLQVIPTGQLGWWAIVEHSSQPECEFLVTDQASEIKDQTHGL